MKVRPIMINIKIIKADKIVTKAADVVTCCATNEISMVIDDRTDRQYKDK